MDEGFEAADSRNLPNVDRYMIDNFYRRNRDFLAYGVQNIKTRRGARMSYVDEAVGYVQVKRSDDKCTVKAKVTPEHKVRETGYSVSLIIDESVEEVLECLCHDCAASEGGCKHAVALLYFLYEKTLQPSVTSVECYWRKSTLSKVGSSLKGQKLKNIFKTGTTRLPPKGDMFLNTIAKKGLERECEGTLFEYFRTEPKLIEKVCLHHLCLEYLDISNNNPNPDSFIQFCEANIDEESCKEIQTVTEKQSACKEWFAARFARITASKLHEAAHCKTMEGATTHAILGAAKFNDTPAMKRGLELEEQVLDVVAKKKGIREIKRSGLVIQAKYPIFGASPDGISDDYCIEIKCPSKEKTVTNYIRDRGMIQPKPFAQLQLQMLLSGKKEDCCVLLHQNLKMIVRLI